MAQTADQALDHVKKYPVDCVVLDIPYTQEELANAVCETVAASGLNDGYIRLVVTRGVGNLGLNPCLLYTSRCV